MKKNLLLLLVAGVVAIAWSVKPAQAVPEFKKKWEAKYVEGNSNQKFVDAAKEAGCNVCHFGKSKKDRNDYGMALSKLLKKDDYKADRVKSEPDKVEKEIYEAFEKVSAEKSKKGKTFGELIKAGELPGTAPE